MQYMKKLQPTDQGVIGTIFKTFVDRLRADSSIETPVIDRLEQTLLVEQDISVEGLRRALFGEELLP